jgi:hypothetical protein
MKPEAFASIVSELSNEDINVCVEAAGRLHKESEAEDLPKLLVLLESNDFFIREAAAWPLVELAGVKFLPELLTAYQRGFDEGHDNDGFTPALLEIPALYPGTTRQALETIIGSYEEPMRGHAAWLLEFCKA